MTESALQPEISLTPDERTLAMLAHILQIFSSFIGPLVIFIVKRDSRFVALHAIQALLLQLAVLTVNAISFGAWFVIFFSTVAVHPQPAGAGRLPLPFLIGFPLIWFVFMGGWLLSP